MLLLKSTEFYLKILHTIYNSNSTKSLFKNIYLITAKTGKLFNSNSYLNASIIFYNINNQKTNWTLFKNIVYLINNS